MPATPRRIAQTYTTVEQAEDAREKAVAEVTTRLDASVPTCPTDDTTKCGQLVAAVTTYGVDYLEIADAAGVSGLTILEFLEQSLSGGRHADSSLEAILHAGLLAERQAAEAYRETVKEAQGREVRRLLAQGRLPATIARELGVSRRAVREWSTND